MTARDAFLDRAKRLGQPLRGVFRNLGLDVVRYPPQADFDEADRALVARVQPFTLTTPERIVALVRAIEYVVERDIEGDIVECGVWKGGSMMAAMLTLLRLGDEKREIHLFDTYEGMTEPTEADIDSVRGRSAADLIE